MVLLRDSEVAQLLGVSRRQIWKLLKTQALPEPVRIIGSVRWREADIDAWIGAGCPANGSADSQKGVPA
jgi:predicted DNA-binding transcriptional regulator AlpA